MTRDDFELIPGKIKSGELSSKKAVEDVIVFIARNKPMYGIQIYDEDFISDFFVYFLERAEKFFLSYDSSQGMFFSYIFCFVKNCCNAVKKQRSLKNIMEYYSMGESITEYEEHQSLYAQIKLDDFDCPKVPFMYTPISPADLKLACKDDTYQFKPVHKKTEPELSPAIRQKFKDYSPHMIQNIIMVLALKSAYYITEEQISNISRWFNLDKKKLELIIQELKAEMSERIMHKEHVIERRNKAYILHKKLQNQIEWNNMNSQYCDYLNEPLRRKYKKSTDTWKFLNYQMKEGMIHIRPTTRIIAKFLDKSARQITYYQTMARKIGLDINEI